MSENVQTLIKRLEQNLVAAADDVDLRHRLANAYLRTGENRAAGEQLKEIGRLHLRRMRVPQAVEALKSAAEHLPEDFRVLEQLYAIHRLAENFDAMVQVGVILADKLRKARQTDRAEEILVRCLQAADDQNEPRRVLVETYVAASRPDKALPHARMLAEQHPEERERRRFEKLAQELASKPLPTAARPKTTGARRPPAGSATSGTAAPARGRGAWILAGSIVVVVAGLGIWRHAGAASLRGEVEGALGLLAAGDLRTAAGRLQAAGLVDLARAAGEAAISAEELDARAQLGAARSGGVAALPRLRELAKDGPTAVRAEAQAAADALAPIEEHWQALSTALGAGDMAAAVASWAVLRDSDSLAGVLAADPGLSERRLRVRLATPTPGALVFEGDRKIGQTPCDLEVAVGAGRALRVRQGALGARIDLSAAPEATWTVELGRDIRWRVATGGAVTGIAATDAMVVAGTLGRELVAVDIATGEPRWRDARLGPGGDVLAPPVIHEGRVLATVGGSRLVARTLADGRPVDGWDGRPVRSAPVLLPDGRVIAVDTAGRVVDLADAAAPPLGTLDGARWCVWMDDFLCVVSPRQVVALDAAGGGVLWNHTAEQPFAGAPVAVGEYVLVPVAGGGVDAFGFDGFQTPDTGWKQRGRAAGFMGRDGLRCAAAGGGLLLVEPSRGVSGTTSEGGLSDLGPVVGCLVDAQGTRYATTRGGVLAAWAARDADNPTVGPGWPADLGAPATTPPLLVGDRVCVGTEDGLVAVAGGPR